MGKGVYEWTWDSGDKKGKTAKMVREADGNVRYWETENEWKFCLSRDTWSKIIATLAEETTPLPHDETPIMGEMIGHRVWLYREPYLTSVWRGGVWAPDDPIVGSLRGDEGGVYAFKDKGRALTVYQSLVEAGDSPVLGTVDLWGDVIETEYGYRAERAAVRSLERMVLHVERRWWQRKTTNAALNELRERYGCAGEP